MTDNDYYKLITELEERMIEIENKYKKEEWDDFFDLNYDGKVDSKDYEEWSFLLGRIDTLMKLRGE